MAYKGTDISAWQGDMDIKSIKFPNGDFLFSEDMQEVQKGQKVDRNVNLSIENGKTIRNYIFILYALRNTLKQAKRGSSKTRLILQIVYLIKPTFLVY